VTVATGRVVPMIYRVIFFDEIRPVFDRYGIDLWHRIPDRPEDQGMDGVARVHVLAAAVRQMVDTDLPDRPGKAADAMDKVADRHASRPYVDEDRVAVTDEHRTLIQEWNDRCGARSPLLGPLTEELGELSWKEFAWVGQARRALEMLEDGDLLLPGLDAALRPVLAVYAGLDETGASV
jgi:hypothetical protein